MKSVGSGAVEKPKLHFVCGGILGHIGCPPFPESFRGRNKGINFQRLGFNQNRVLYVVHDFSF
jgi:hypothetical protein